MGGAKKGETWIELEGQIREIIQSGKNGQFLHNVSLTSNLYLYYVI